MVLATNQPAAVSNLVEKTTGISVKVPDPNDPVEKEFKKLEEQDDTVHTEVDRWIRENNELRMKGTNVFDAELNDRIRKQLAPVQQAYEDFIRRHPEHVGARLAYASFLDDIGDEDGSLLHLEKARDLDPKDPAVWNNLANHYGHSGGVTNAFAGYEKAISLDPNEPVYYHNFGTTVYLFRKDAREFYHLNEDQVFDKAMALYSNSMRLDPTNFVLAADVAQSYYGIRPLRTNDALQAWTNALKLAGTEVEREGVYLHLARWKMNGGHYAEARAQLNSVTNAANEEIKNRLLRNLNEREHETNSVPGSAKTNSPAKPSEPALLETNRPPKEPPPK